MNTEFVEKILSVAEQQERSKEWYGDAHYSDNDATVKQTLKSFDENFFYFEGELRKFIYEIPRCKLPGFKKSSVWELLSVLDDPTYSPDRDMTDDEMDTLL